MGKVTSVAKSVTSILPTRAQPGFCYKGGGELKMKIFLCRRFDDVF